MKLSQALTQSIKQMNGLSRAYIRIGNLLAFSCAAAAVFCRLSAGRIGICDNMLWLGSELASLTRQLIETFHVPALLIEIIRLAGRIDRLIN